MCKYFVMQMMYVCVLCASCGNPQYCVLHHLRFVNAGPGCKGRPYGIGILRVDLVTVILVAMNVFFCLSQTVAVSAFIICRGVCACTEMV